MISLAYKRLCPCANEEYEKTSTDSIIPWGKATILLAMGSSKVGDSLYVACDYFWHLSSWPLLISSVQLNLSNVHY